MIDHIGLRTVRFESSKQFSIFVLAPLGITPSVEYPEADYGAASVIDQDGTLSERSAINMDTPRSPP